MKEKITNLELTSTMFLLLFSCSLGLAPYITIKIAGIDAYIGVIIGSLLGIIPLLLLLYLFNYEIDKPIYEKTKIIFGKILGTIVNILLAILYFAVAVTMLFNMSNFIISQYLTNTPIIIVIIIISLVIFFSLNKGIPAITKTSCIYVIIIIILFILEVVGLIPEVKLDNLKPVLEYGIKSPTAAGILYSLLLTSPIYSLLIIPKKDIENNKKTKKYLFISYTVVVLMIFFISLVTSSCLGKYLLELFQYPAYITLKKISIFGFIDRIENFLSIQWILSSFITITIPIFYIKGNKNNKILNLIIIALLIIVASTIFKNNTTYNHYLITYYPYVFLILFIIHIIIFLTILIKKCIKRK